MFLLHCNTPREAKRDGLVQSVYLVPLSVAAAVSAAMQLLRASPLA